MKSAAALSSAAPGRPWRVAPPVLFNRYPAAVYSPGQRRGGDRQFPGELIRPHVEHAGRRFLRSEKGGKLWLTRPH